MDDSDTAAPTARWFHERFMRCIGPAVKIPRELPGGGLETVPPVILAMSKTRQANEGHGSQCCSTVRQKIVVPFN